MTSSLRY
jgi:hypothetical protein